MNQNVSMLKKNAREWVDENEELLKGVVRKIWEYAELALKEYESSKLLADELENKGFIIQRGLGVCPRLL